jgi:hypothetical protein
MSVSHVEETPREEDIVPLEKMAAIFGQKNREVASEKLGGAYIWYNTAHHKKADEER